jgi:hypothetical protein
MIGIKAQSGTGGNGTRIKVPFPDRYLDVAVEMAAAAVEQIDLAMLGLEEGAGPKEDHADLHEAMAGIYECLRLIGEVQSRRAMLPKSAAVVPARG